MTLRARELNISKGYQFTVWLGLLALAFLVGTYAILINNIILNLAERESHLRDITKIESILAQSEAKYIALTNQITPELAYELGYRDATLDSAYVAVGSTPPVVAQAPDNDS